ncbi:hypothetical protein BaRGS_00000461 [Batillaria attramentaria]|uniref:Uncharacterized protein n=1 Tax=Batillaria attramentaria TaxID=370345 RepID=A0ABD0M9H5_9CAEN
MSCGSDDNISESYLVDFRSTSDRLSGTISLEFEYICSTGYFAATLGITGSLDIPGNVVTRESSPGPSWGRRFLAVITDVGLTGGSTCDCAVLCRASNVWQEPA